jgi:hypothetical protein
MGGYPYPENKSVQTARLSSKMGRMMIKHWWFWGRLFAVIPKWRVDLSEMLNLWAINLEQWK